jgi:hypothetical protein
MDFSIVSQNLLTDGCTRFIIRVQPNQLVYFGFFIEAFEGMCLYTTPTKGEPLLQVDVVPDFLAQFEHILSYMQQMSFSVPASR